MFTLTRSFSENNTILSAENLWAGNKKSILTLDKRETGNGYVFNLVQIGDKIYWINPHWICMFCW